VSSRAVLTPYSAELAGAPSAQLAVVNTRPALAFDDTTNETVVWTLIAPADGFTAPLSLVISYVMASAITGTVYWSVAIEAISSGDATDLDSVASFGATNGASSSVPATAGYLTQLLVALADLDSVAAADYVRLLVMRNAVTDTATGDALLLAVEVRDSA
jgi:hypothetical protein